MQKGPDCPKGHGALEFRAIEQRHFTDRAPVVTAIWVCPQCGYHDAHAASEAEEVRQVCDFCSRPNPVKVYGCRDFAYYIVAFGSGGVALSQPAFSQGQWLACAPCSALIDADDRKGLTERVVSVMSSVVTRSDPDKREVVAESLRQLHAAFFAHRILNERR